jgi:hypothetical protein
MITFFGETIWPSESRPLVQERTIFYALSEQQYLINILIIVVTIARYFSFSPFFGDEKCTNHDWKKRTPALLTKPNE